MSEVDAAVGSIAWMEHYQQLADDVVGVLSDRMRDTWARMGGDPRSDDDWRTTVLREFSESELAAWRERLAEAMARPITPEELEHLRDQLRLEHGSR
jgi:hypothetical protein